MKLFLNQQSASGTPYILLPPTLTFQYLPNYHQYCYLPYPSPSLQLNSPFYLQFAQFHHPPLSSNSFHKESEQQAPILLKEAGLQNLEKGKEVVMEKKIQECVKGRIREQKGQLSQGMVSRSGNDRFIKKNTQSNIINQILSFLWTPQKSMPLVSKLLFSEHKVTLFYSFFRTIKQHCKSMLNRNFLKHLTCTEGWEVVFKKLKKKIKSQGMLQKEELSSVVRRLALVYLREICRYSIMTSKKMNRRLWDLHFKKCHEIRQFLFGAEEC